ncbi:MAG: methyltransferase domain-containing protein [Candidatus Omnitrophica bacterium]|nr:methyltransferase domain-containing protein [Candidatus Omnitrophota bacterium]MDD5553965.1 methyltransferase domain-containing protein [Candidatus Omnitrophota bacterium]
MPREHWGVRLYYSRFMRGLLRNSVFRLEKELRDCGSVLDLGCGYNSPLKYTSPRFSVGVEYFLPFILESRAKSIHRYYIRADINSLGFKPGSFDAVLLLGLIEHLDKENALRLLEKAGTIARKKVIVLTPNGFLKQFQADGNEMQAHKSGWSVRELRGLGFKPYGMNGFKAFRKDVHLQDKEHREASILSTVRFWPRPVWLIISEITQVIAYYLPTLAFEVFYVKAK